MISANSGNIELFKLFLDKGCDYHSKDIYQFSALLYAIKSQCLSIFFYLIALGADIYDCDSNASSIAHWSAYNNNKFLL